METPSWRERLKASTSSTLPGTREERWIFRALMLLAAILRMWDLPHIPFMHDEISALVRLYPTLGETIQKGVIELDTHPPGMQVFEWLWTRAFGSEEWVIKLPFMLLSLAALFFLYRFVCAWTNATVALISTALFATLQYFVLYGQLARPYAFGLFTTALVADQLTRLIAQGGRRPLHWAMLGGVLSAYAHHFALMQVLVMAATAFFLIARDRDRYLTAFGICVVLYLPNVPIILHQLSQGGLSGWLPQPDRSWLGDYAWWIAHCSWLMAGVLIALLAFSLVQRVSNGSRGGPFLSIGLIWGLLPLGIGYAYSLWRAPVLQYSVLLFSFPYLLILLLSGIKHLPWKRSVIIIVATVITSVFTLISTRRHYELFYRSKYVAFIREGMQAQDRYGREDCLVLLDAPDHVIQFYLKRWGINEDAFPYVQLRDRYTPALLDSVLANSRTTHLFLGASNGSAPEINAHIERVFPGHLARTDLCEGRLDLYSRTTMSEELDLDRIAQAEAGVGSSGDWKIAPELPLRYDRDSIPCWDQGGREYGIEYRTPASDIVQRSFDRIELWAEIEADPRDEVHLTAELRDGDQNALYRSCLNSDVPTSSSGIQHLVVPISPEEARRRGRQLEFLAYIWNRSLGPLCVRAVGIDVREGNPVQYAFFGPVRGEWKYRKPLMEADAVIAEMPAECRPPGDP